MRQRSIPSLSALSARAPGALGRYIADEGVQVALAELDRRSSLNVPLTDLRNRSVLVRTGRQITAALSLLELDGVARRIVLCPPDFSDAHIPFVTDMAEIDAEVGDPPGDAAGGILAVTCCPEVLVDIPAREGNASTEWILFTSGTTGTPKMVVHTLDTLLGPIDRARKLGAGAVWSTFYDIRRYGGLQILLRAFVGGGSMVLSSARQTSAEYLQRVARAGVSHISGTPSHWRMALMSPAARDIAPDYVRMSGEIADQAIIDRLQHAYPRAKVAHAFASTEAGVAFEVNDGLAGFSTDMLGRDQEGMALRVVDDSLRIRSSRVALGYLGNHGKLLADADGFVDTGDVVVPCGSRYHFVGRTEGIINVGGLKVHPEEVEAVINQHPDVEMSLVKARANPMTGAVVVADIVAKPLRAAALSGKPETDRFKAEVIELCRKELARYKVPVVVGVVPALELGAAGKLVRARA
jgi:acyl-CoA synthetase (AMP-forming)/AMP-acid ligase II